MVQLRLQSPFHRFWTRKSFAFAQGLKLIAVAIVMVRLAAESLAWAVECSAECYVGMFQEAAVSLDPTQRALVIANSRVALE